MWKHGRCGQVTPLPWEGKLYEIQRQAITPGLRGVNLGVEARLDGTLAARHGDRYLAIQECVVAEKPKKSPVPKPEKTRAHRSGAAIGTRIFDLKKGPKVLQAVQASGRKASEDAG